MRRVIIVGGGITGLAAAHALDRAIRRGDVDQAILLEAGARLGGKILSERVGGFLIEGGPDSFITLKPQAVAFAREVGLGDDITGTLPPRDVFIRHHGRLVPIPEGLTGLVPQRLAPFVRSPLFSLIEKMRFGLEPLIPASRNGADESLGSFVRRRLGQAAVDRLAAPLLAGIHAGDVERLSLRATFPQLADAVHRHGSLTRAVLARGRTGAASNDAPPTGPTLPMFMTLRGGLQELVSAAVRSINDVTIRTGAPVSTILRHQGRYLVDLAGGERLEAGAVILTVPAHAAAPLVVGVNAPAARVAERIRSISTAVVALGFRRSDVRHRLEGHGYVGSHHERTVHTACTWVSSKWADRAPAGMVLLRCFVGRDGAQAALTMGDDDLTAAVVDELRPLLGITGAPALRRVFRWQDAMPQYEVGHLDRLATMQAALEATPGLILAGSPYRGVGLPDCIAQGTHAAHQAVNALLAVRPDARPT